MIVTGAKTTMANSRSGRHAITLNEPMIVTGAKTTMANATTVNETVIVTRH